MLYRVSINQHAVGDLIAPGWFGNHYRSFRPGSAYPAEPNFTSLMIEIALESARKSVMPSAPSRMDCIFTCETLQDATTFRASHRGGQGFIYGVEPAHPSTATFRGNFTAISTPVGPTPYVDYLSDRARDYWTTNPQQMVEVLVGGPVKVLTGPLP